MKKFNGYDDASKAARFTGGRLPAGGYVCKVQGVKYIEGSGNASDRIKIQIDVAEGEHKDFFRKLYDNDAKNEDRRWRGTATIWVPKDDGTKQDEWTKNTFASWTNGLEDSNPGYKWDWDESKWKDKMLGIVFGETGTVIDGKEIVYTEARRGESVEDIRSGNFREQKFKAKNGYTGKGNNSGGQLQEDTSGFMSIDNGGADEEIPF